MKVHLLDTHHRGRPGIVAAAAVESDEGPILFDTGPESSFGSVTSELKKAGFGLGDIRHVFLSHIHFDHAGAAWRFAELGAMIYVHPRGASHLLDPTRLVASATRIYGDKMEQLWGRFAPVAPERLRVLEDGEIVRVPPFEIKALATPGHANHHHVYHWNDNLYGGDVVGVRIGDGPGVPPLVPPELHIESWLESIEKIRALKVARLFLPHCGVVEGGVSSYLDDLAERIRRWSVWFRDQIQAGRGEEQLVSAFADKVTGELRQAGATEKEIADYESADPSFMAVSAATRYWNKYHPEELKQIP